MQTNWHETFRDRMRRFQARRPNGSASIAVSIKVRVTSGCFHREHSPQAYEIIDQAVISSASDNVYSFEEHESGPELLIYLAATTAGISLAASVVNLITAIVQARSKGIKKGDRPSDPLELIVRRIDEAAGYREEIVLKVSSTDRVEKKQIADVLAKGVQKLLDSSK